MTSSTPNMGPGDRTKDRVRIFVDELTGVIPDPGNQEPIRALSLNRLHITERDVEPLYKCPSFPRLSHRSAGNRGNGTNHHVQGTDCFGLGGSLQHADSVSVQPSLGDLSPVDGDDNGGGRSPRGLGAAAPGGMLPRCSSARAVGECYKHHNGSGGGGGRLPPLDYSRSHRPGSSSHLLPPDRHVTNPSSAVDALVARSTSCPAIHPDSRAASHPHHGGAVSPHHLQELDGDVDLDGEVIMDLPIEAGQTFPDFFPVADRNGSGPGGRGGGHGPGARDTSERFKDTQQTQHKQSSLEGSSPSPNNTRQTPSTSTVPPTTPTTFQFEEHPMHTRRIRERSSGDLAQYSNGRLAKTHRNKSTMLAAAAHNDGFLNIRDIPSSIAQKVILDQEILPEQRDKVQAKCMKWLHTLNNQ